MEDKVENDQPAKANYFAADSSGFGDVYIQHSIVFILWLLQNSYLSNNLDYIFQFEASELDDEFGNDLYATIPEMTPGQSSNPMQDLVPPSKADEDSKLKAFIENSGFDWQR